MPAANNLTRDEAQERARLLTVASYRVVLDLDGGSTATFGSRTEATFGCREPGASTFAELEAPAVRSVTLNGVALDPALVFDGHRLRLDDLAEANELVVEADCAYMHTGEGLHRFVDPVDSAVYLYTQFEPYDAHRMYACFDQPDLKASFDLTVTAPAGWTCVSNGAVDARPEPARAGRWHFAATPVLSTYVTALVAGPYHEVRSSVDGPAGPIDLGLYCRGSLAEHLDADELFLLTRQGFEFYHRIFDYPYPFGKYDQLFVPEFNAGAMENAGCVTFLEDYVFRSKVTDAAYERRSETLLHEMAHMWFGDLVTMRWWDDLWLNESFATFISVLAQVSATRFTGAWTTFANAEKTWALRQDQLPSTHPISTDAGDIEQVKTNFDGITYAKGASVLKQLVAWVGQEEFLTGLRAYFRRHEFANTSLADLLAVLAETSGRDLSSWSREWLTTTGVNTMRARFGTDAAGLFTSFAVVQEAPSEHPTLRRHRMAVGLYDLAPTGSGLVRRDRVELDVVGALTEVPGLVGARQPDLLLLNDDDLAFTKIRLDDRSLATVAGHIGELASSLPRALCWAASWDMCRDAELAASDYVRLVTAGMRAETDIGVVQGLLRQAQSAVTSYGDPGRRRESLAALSDAAWERMLGAEPGGDHQLAFARGAAAAAVTAAQVARLRGLLDGSAPVGGLRVDPELRWWLLSRLCVLGAAGEGEVAAESERDATATGARQAAGCRAALPAAESKAATWATVTTDDSVPNALLAAMVGGFWQPEQLETLAPYRERYFEVVGAVWAARTSEMASVIAGGLYPALLVDDETVAATDSYRRDASPEPALGRILLEGRDGVARALRCRAVDTAARSGAGGPQHLGQLGHLG